MGIGSKSPQFGHKGVRDSARSFAESLLTGKPLARAPQKDRALPFKPRLKPKFGRRNASDKLAEKIGHRGDGMARRHDSKFLGSKFLGWKFWATITVAVVLSVQALAGVFDWPSPTLGGRQLWTDVRVQGGWRVQCHAWTGPWDGHCRLLDNHDIRRTWGGEAQMTAVLDQAVAAGRVAAPRPHAVVLVHGLGRSAHSFDTLAAALDARGYEVVKFNYASTQAAIADHATALNRVVDGLQGVEQVSFVTHSLGGVVLRQALALEPAWRDRVKPGRSVLLAAPNQGSAVARTLQAYAPARWLFGPVLGELADDQAIKGLASPASFATVAGTKNPLWFLADESDGLVSVQETHLTGEAEHLSVAAAHTFIMNDQRVMDFTLGFIAGQ